MSTLQISKYESNYTLPLYSCYGDQESRAYLSLDTRDGEILLHEQAPHDNSYSSDEAAGHVRSWQIPNNLTVSGLNALLDTPKILALLERVLAGAEEIYNGNNYTTILNDDANDAKDELFLALERINEWNEYDSLEPRDVDDYYQLSSYATLVVAGETHETASERLSAEARKNGHYCTAGAIERYLDRSLADND